jgi:MFS family permease
VRSNPQEKGLDQVGSEKSDAAQSDSSATENVSTPKWTVTVKSIIKMGSVWYLGVVYFFFGLSYIIYMVFFAAYLVKEMGLSQEWAGGLWALVGGLSIFCGVLVLGLSYILYAVIKVPIGFYLSAILFGLTAWSIPTIMAAAAGDFVGPRLAPAGLGFITLFFGIGQALGPALGGYLADVSGSFTLPFLIAGVISLIGMVLSFYLKKPIAE